eukprot:TRINITY_DN45087_c0_g1_i1.p1 TRINITY_DN45087_c0_g1~~TRINITY_DN45087_c0_g1_i1.p1  ORF type:complete len:258 (-),score=24.36 TRINITY_DN45087_c0_g1_i1:208-981(-)
MSLDMLYEALLKKHTPFVHAGVAAAVAVVGALSIVGFIPAILLWLEQGEWKLDPFYGAGLPTTVPLPLLNWHAALAIAWLVAAVFQCLVGAGIIPLPLWVHRASGYVLCIWGVAAFGTGSVLEVLEFGGTVTILHLFEAAMILVNMAFVISSARQGKVASHAHRALALVLWCLYPGLARVVGFAVGALAPCGIDVFDGYEFIAASMCSFTLWAMQRRPCVNAKLFVMYAAVDLVHAVATSTFLQCPQPQEQTWHFFD